MNNIIIPNKFLYYESRARFNEDLAAEKISDKSVVFIGSDQTIWTHGKEFGPGILKNYVDRLYGNLV